MLTADQEQSLLGAMAAAECRPHKTLTLQADGKIRRYRIDGDKSGSLNGWYALYSNMGIYAGAFGSWKSGASHSWCSKDKHEISPAEREGLRLRYEQVQKERDAESKRVRAAAANKAQRLWDAAQPVKIRMGDHGDELTHPYLLAKGVKPFGIKRLKESLVVPIRNASGSITSLQFIQSDGSKRFLTGGEITACYFTVGKFDTSRIYLCEGVATGLTAFMALGGCVAIAFNAGNLPAVGKVLREKYPKTELIYLADNDHATEGNPGLTSAQVGAKQTEGRVIYPVFEAGEMLGGHVPTDFNDLHQLRGLASVRAYINAAIAGNESQDQIAEPAPECSAPPKGTDKPAASSSKQIKDFETLIEESDDFEFLTDGLLRKIATAELKRPAVEYLISKIAKKADTTKAALLDELKLLAGGGASGESEDGGDDIVRRLNDKHAVVQWEGSTLIASFEKCPVTRGRAIKYSSRRDFELRYLNQKTWMGDEQVSIAEYWLHHPDRRQYDGTLFLPGIEQAECGAYLNLWNGWGVIPRPGDCQEYLDFVFDQICSGNKDLFYYLIRWCAHLVQRPRELPETVITLRGGQGLGKNTFVEPLMLIVGSDHAIEVTSAEHVTGRFNGHLENALLVFNNESLWGGDKSSSGRLKGMATDQRGLVERKGKDAKVSLNFKRLINASNNIWAAHTELEDRRNVIIDVNPHKAPRELFARLKAQMANKRSPGVQALFHYLLHEVDISGWHPRDVPACLKRTGREMALESEPTPFRWWNSVLEDRYLFIDSDQFSEENRRSWPEMIPKGELHDIYLAWCRKRLISHPEGREFFARCLYRCGFSDSRPRREGGGRYNAFKVPAFIEAVRVWCDKFSFDPAVYVDEDEWRGQGGQG